MSQSNDPPKDHPSPSSSRPRRASIADLFSRPGNITNPNNAQPQNQQPGQRRMSLTTIGLGIPGSSPTQPSPFGSMRRRASVSSSVVSTSPTTNNHNHHANAQNGGNENAIIEDDEGETPATTPASASASTSTSPFARRVSFGGVGARARSGSGISPSAGTAAAATAASSTSSPSSGSGGAGTAVPRTSPFQFKRTPSYSQPHSNQQSVTNLTTSPSAEGFNWPEALRTRAERAPSFTQGLSTSPGGSGGMHVPGMMHGHGHGRSASIASMESNPARTDPIVDMPVQTPRVATEQKPQRRKVNKPDYFQEKILRADFMD